MHVKCESVARGTKVSFNLFGVQWTNFVSILAGGGGGAIKAFWYRNVNPRSWQETQKYPKDSVTQK